MSEYAHLPDAHTHTHTHTHTQTQVAVHVPVYLKITTELECSIGEPIRDIDANSYTGRRRVLVINRTVVEVNVRQIYIALRK